MELDEQPYTIVGVAPEGLVGRYMKMDVDGWVPLGVPGGIYRATPRALEDRDSRQFFMLGRLAPGRTADEAQAEMRVLAARIHEHHPTSWEDARGEAKELTVVPEAESRVPPHIRTALLGTAAVLLAGGLLVLFLACSNVASLLLARAHRRSWEMAVRVSLGAGRGRLFRMLLAESLLLSGLGGALGLYLTHLATDYFRAVPLPMDIPLRFDIRLDGSVLLFTLALSLGASFLAGIGPALRGSRPNITPVLKGDSVRGGGEPRRITLRSLLVVGQVAAATLFVVGAGLALRSVQASTTYDLGLDAEGVAVAWAEPPEEGLPSSELRAHFLALAERVQSQPEVETVALSRTAEAHPLMDDFATSLVELEEGEALRVRFNAVTEGYFQMLNIPLSRGREILAGDVEGGPAVAVVNQAFAERFFPGQDCLGEVFRVSAWFDADRREDRPGTTFEIVGIVPAPERSGGNPPGPFFWLSFLQDPPVRAIVHAKGGPDARALVPVLRREVTSSSVAFTPVEPGVYTDYIDYRFLGHKIVSAVLSFAGLFALVLAFIGVFGIVSFAVTQRYREMAIRRAMGARKGQVITTLLRRDLVGTAVGILLGLALSVPLAFLARASLLGVEPLDPAAVGGGAGILVLASLLAGVIPTRHLLRAEPMDVLREE
jgi:predicted permease